MPLFTTTTNGSTVTLPSQTKACRFTVWSAGGGSGGGDGGGIGGRGGDGCKLLGVATFTSGSQTLLCRVGQRGAGGINRGSGGTGGANGGGDIPGGSGGNASTFDGVISSGGGGAGGGASALYLGGTPIVVAGGGAGGGGGGADAFVRVCGTLDETTPNFVPLVITAPSGYVFYTVPFASYGTPGGSCGSFGFGGCHSSNSQPIANSVLLGSNSGTLYANNETYGDPCRGTYKRFYVEALAVGASSYPSGTLNNYSGIAGGNATSRSLTTSVGAQAGQTGTTKTGGAGAGAGGGGGGAQLGFSGAVGQDFSNAATGGQAGSSAYNTTYVTSITQSSNASEPYGYGTPDGNNINGFSGAVSLLYPRLDFFGIAVGTQSSTEGNVNGTVGDSVELTWVTTDVDDVLINGVNEGNGSNGVAFTKFYNGLTAGTTTFNLIGRFDGVTGVEQSRSVTMYAPPTATISVSPLLVTVGDTVTITWSTTNATSRSIDNGIGSVAVSGSTTKTISVVGITTFIITATNFAGRSVTASATVEAFNPPVIDSITNNPVIPDQDSTFSLVWQTTDASSVSIPGVGSGLPVDGNQSLVATVDQSGAGGYPGAPSFGNGYRDYVITACNPAGRCVNETLRVFIKPQPPRITLYSISPSEVNFGGTITFTWTTIYSLSGSIDSSVGATTPIASGTKTSAVTGNIQDFVSNSTKTYTMSVTGYGGTESNSYNVNVLIDTTPNSWIFTSKTSATINTTYYASSNTTTPL